MKFELKMDKKYCMYGKRWGWSECPNHDFKKFRHICTRHKKELAAGMGQHGLRLPECKEQEKQEAIHDA